MRYLVLQRKAFWQCLFISCRHKIKIFNIMELNKDNFFIRYKENEELMRITFCYGDKVNIKQREFNFIRNKNEQLDVALSRIRAKVITADQPKRKKKQKPPLEDLNNALNLEIKLTRFDQVVDGDTPNLNAWTNDTLVTVGENTYCVLVNGPEISILGLPKVIMSGYLLYPKLCLENATKEDSTFTWFRSINKEESKLFDEELLHTNKPGECWLKISEELFYCTSVKDVGHKLKFFCTPKSQKECGKSEEIISPNSVIAGPDKCPFEDRFQYTKHLTLPGNVRCVSYNILADLYADTDTARNELFAHCPAEFLNFEYRKQLYIKELLGYNGDIICLQEVDRKVFQHDLIPVLTHFGLNGVYNEKGGQVVEGLACFYRSSKFRILHSEGVILSQILPTEPILKDLWDKISENEKLTERIINRTTALQIVLLECIDVPNKQILVANTHLYWRPLSDNIRLFQAAICMRYLEYKMQKFQEETPNIEKALILCGDFNSCPDFGAFKYMTQSYIPKNCEDWKSRPEEAVQGLALKHSFNLESGCGTPAYTNFTQGFNGCLDYIFYDKRKFVVTDVVPSPTDKQVKELTALPNKKFPSDHIAQICTITWKK